MTTRPDYELLKEAYAIIDGVPEEVVASGAPCSKIGATLLDGTVCSPEGWLALHPTFNALGLSVSADGTSLRFNGEDLPIATAMAKVFHMSEDEAAQLFEDPAAASGGEPGSAVSHKQLWQTRIRHHIHTKAFSETLSTMAMAPSVTLATIADAIEGDPR